MIDYSVNRDSPVPAYYQIALDLRQRISGGEWRAGNKLPAEPELAEQYNVSRMTLRQAMAELVKEGILVRQRGAGTFVDQGYIHISQSFDEPIHVFSNSPKDKNTLRQLIWDQLRQVAIPDSRFHWNFEEFVPDFAGSEQCVLSIRNMEWYQESKILFVAPDNSLTKVRQQAIEDQKTLIVATYALARGFHLIVPGNVPAGLEHFAATLDGLEIFSKTISLEDILPLGKIDLLITGISLVTDKGVRWGKGHGYFDLEWAMFREVDCVDELTPIIAVGHDCQVVSNELEPSAVDTITDAIVTPTRVINVEKKHAKPSGIHWNYVSPELLERIPPLKTLFTQREQMLSHES
ncbi:MAG: GntR family transcriptional regulator [Ardenticatenaceae bacterium]|nr:GntR family transcriptional regulator [Ardenticatenaceae bacterium]MCB9445502.1 GntR family transcriptional regulator [Ardenticatenaceae bacterium]